MKTILIALLISSCSANSQPCKPLKATSFTNNYISSLSYDKFCIKNKSFSCELKEDFEKLSEILKDRQVPIPEFDIVEIGKGNIRCEIQFKGFLQVDTKYRNLKIFRQMIVKSFIKLLDILIFEDRTIPFDIYKNSFFYDSTTNTILITDYHPMKQTGQKNLKKETFRSLMMEKLEKVLYSFESNNLIFDFEIQNFAVKNDGFSQNSLFKKKGEEKLEDNSDIKDEGFLDKFEVKVTRNDGNLWIELNSKDNITKYRFNGKRDILSIYICQLNAKRVNECINLTEDTESSEMIWKFTIKKNLRYDFTIEQVKDLGALINSNYFKVFLTLMDKDARGVVPNTDLRSDNFVNSNSMIGFDLFDDGSDNLRINDRDSPNIFFPFTMKSKPLKTSKDVQIYRVYNDQDKYRKSYKVITLFKNTLIIKDEVDDNPASISVLNQKIGRFSIIKVCKNPLANVFGRFEDNLYKLKMNNEEKNYQKFVNLAFNNSSKGILDRCIEVGANSKYSIRYEMEKTKSDLNLSWNFNTGSDELTKKILDNKIYLSNLKGLQTPSFECKTFEYPKFTSKSIFFSISKCSDKNEFKLQGVFFKETREKPIIIHPESDDVVVSFLPKDIYFNKDYSLSRDKLAIMHLVEQKVSYLNDNEIVYNIKNECLNDYIPTIELSKNKLQIIIDCVWTKSYLPLSTSDSFEKNKKNLVLGLNNVVESVIRS